MSAKQEKTQFQIETATESDWPWIEQGQVEIVWVGLDPERRQEADREAIEQRVAQDVANIREDEGFQNVAFVARAEDGTRAGFIWVAKSHHDFTGHVEASLLSQYVEEPYRGQGLGRRLMETAEEWARQQGLPRISLSVGARNKIAQGLYESLGYHVETLRMTKSLTPQENEQLLVND